MIVLDTPLDPIDAADATFATDNFKAGELIGAVGQGHARRQGGKDAKIALLDLAENQPTVDVLRDQGFMKGFGIDVKDPKRYGDENDPRIVGHDVTAGAEEGGRTAMENLLQKDPDINVVYTINEPAAAGAYEALKAAGKEKDVLDRLGRRRLPGRQERRGRRDRRDLAAVPAADGLARASRRSPTSPRPARSPSRPRASTSSTPASTLITDKPVDGVPSITSAEGLKQVLGLICRPGAAGGTAGRAAATGPGRPERARDTRHDAASRTPRATQAAEFEKVLDRSDRGVRPSTRRGLPAQAAAALPARLSRPRSRSSCCCSASLSQRHRRRTRFFDPFNLSLILQQVTIIGILGHRPDADHPDRRHRPLGRRDHGAVLGRDGPARAWSMGCAGRRSPSRSGLLVGALCGCINGVLVTRLRLPPFIVTLGTWSIFGALNLWYSQSETIRQQDVEADRAVPAVDGQPHRVRRRRITYGSILMLLLAGIVWYILNRTAFGRHIYAIGDDPDAARLAGINTDRTLSRVYIARRA